MAEASYQVTGSIVTYRNDRTMLLRAGESFLNTKLNVRLFIIDNSPDASLADLFNDERVEYIFNNKNLGFGKAHNIAMRKAMECSRYHLVLNPDVYFGENTLEQLYAHMEQHPDVGQMMPKVLYPDGAIQRLCKLLPTPVDLIVRRFLPNFEWVARRNHSYELIDTGYDTIMNIPYLSGCFMFLRVEALKAVGLFDERIFMYIEDTDLTRRIHERYKTLFFPDVHVYHHYAKGSYKSLRLMFYNMHGAFIYFNKWGWFFDGGRVAINKRVLRDYITKK